MLRQFWGILEKFTNFGEFEILQKYLKKAIYLVKSNQIDFLLLKIFYKIL